LRFLKEVSSTLLSKGLIGLITFGTSVVLARALQPYGKGILGTMYVTGELVAYFGTIGAGTALTFLIAEARLPRPEVAATASMLALAGGVIVGLLVVLLGPVMRAFFLADLAWWTILAAAFFGAARAVSSYMEGIARGFRHIYACNLAAVVQVGGYGFVVLVLLGFKTLTPATALGALSLSFLVSALVYAISYSPSDVPFGFTLSPRVIRALFVHGAAYQAVGLLQMVHYRSDILLVGHYNGAENAGWYSTAAGLAQILWNVPVAVGYVLMPWSSGKEPHEAGERTAVATRLTLAFTALAAVSLGLLATPFIRLAYGAAFLPAAAPLRVLLPGVVASGALHVLGSFLMGRGLIRPLIMITGMCAGLNLALNILLLPRYGIQGAALVSSMTYTIGALLLIRVVSRYSDVPFRGFFRLDSRDLRQVFFGFRTP
jgi:O-antigen/teichoic acid export membrane protein